MSRTFENYFSERGVQFVKHAPVAEVKRDRGLKVVTQNGKTVPCDMLVAGIGVRPATDVLMDSGIEMGDGVVVNEFLETNEPWIYGAGDVANYEDALFGVRRRAEHWDNAVSQGQHCARVLAGERKPFVHVPYFFSDVFDLSYEYWGDGTGADEVVERGDLHTSSFSVWWLKDKRLVAAFMMNRPDEERNVAPQWIESKRHIASEELRGDRWPTG
jgi:NADPH-dependent 2,4-dienoyl-CoA reductase/sulfur reductase-like enzyme